MKENKKDIERLFQEKFKDFEATPPLESWANIEERLNQKKKKRRVIPFWFKTSGIAATLILGVFLFMNKKENLNNTINEVVIENNTISNTENPSINSSKINEVVSEELIKSTNVNTASDKVIKANDKQKIAIQDNRNSGKQENVSVEENSLNKTKRSSLFNTKNQIVASGSEKKSSKENNNKASKNNINLLTNRTEVNENVVVTNQSSKEEKLSSKKNKASENNINLLPNKTEVNENVVATNKNSKEEKLSSKKNIELNGVISSNNLKEDFIVDSNNNKKPSENNLNLSTNDLKNKEQNLIVKEDLGLNKNKHNLPTTNNVVVVNSDEKINEVVIANSLNNNNMNLDAVVLVQNNTIANAIQDSALVAEVNTEENPLEKLLKEKLEGKNVDEKEKEKRNKWVASTYASPVYFNSTAQGSPIDDQFKESSKGFKSTLSYGLGLEYEVSKKLSIKTGVNSLAFNYTTNDVFYTTSLQSVTQNVETITRNNNGENLALANRNMMIDAADVENFIQNNEGSLNQEMGYIEVPLELSYKILDKKFGINVIGGMSTLFLNTNTVSLISNQAETNIGSANNLNNIHFSSNFGLGFKYAFWKSFQANFQPMFKYQINTFSNDSGNFKPYFVGLYSGVSFSF